MDPFDAFEQAAAVLKATMLKQAAAGKLPPEAQAQMAGAIAELQGLRDAFGPLMTPPSPARVPLTRDVGNPAEVIHHFMKEYGLSDAELAALKASLIGDPPRRRPRPPEQEDDRELWEDLEGR